MLQGIGCCNKVNYEVKLTKRIRESGCCRELAVVERLTI